MCIKLDIQVHGQSDFPFLHFRPTYVALFLCQAAHKNHKQVRIRFSSYLVILMQEQDPVFPHSRYHIVHHSHAGHKE